jgi:hypothetical protein
VALKQEIAYLAFAMRVTHPESWPVAIEVYLS